MERVIPHHLVLSTIKELPLGQISWAGMPIGGGAAPGPKPRKLLQYALIYIMGGEGFFWSGKVRRKLVPGDLLFLFPNVGHNYLPAKGQILDELYLLYAGSLFDLLLREKLVSPDQPIWHVEPISYWRDRLIAVLDPDLHPLQRTSRLLMTLIDMQLQPHKASDPEWLLRTTTLMEESALSTRGIAEKLNMTYDQFRKKFQKLTKESPEKYRRRMEMREAGLRLVNSEASIERISDDLGYSDPFTFARSFKKVMGTTPARFRAGARTDFSGARPQD